MRPFPRFNPQLNISVPQHYAGILEKYRDYSMIASKPDLFLENMLLMDFIGRVLPGDFVECGTWRGGMSCAMMAVGGTNRNYHFFDSFEGLPEPQQLDGQSAFDYQKNTGSPDYHDNCSADYGEFVNLVNSQDTPTDRIHVYKGWFEETLGTYPGTEIAVLRLDGDWYESTMTCLDQLFPYVSFGGIVLLDDYDAWDGCARATHDFLSKNKSRSRLFRTPLTNIAYIQKIDDD